MVECSVFTYATSVDRNQTFHQYYRLGSLYLTPLGLETKHGDIVETVRIKGLSISLERSSACLKCTK